MGGIRQPPTQDGKTHKNNPTDGCSPYKSLWGAQEADFPFYKLFSEVVIAGWPIPPSREEWCHACPAGWATNRVDQDHCTMCIPGSYAQTSQSPACLACPNGTYTDSWGSSNCNHCIIGTFAPYQVCTHQPAFVSDQSVGSTRGQSLHAVPF